MLYAKIGSNDKVSRLGFGAMRFPCLKDGKIDRAQSLPLIDAAIKGGVNYFDTAYGYHNGESEVFLNEALNRYPRDSFFLADKLPSWMLNEHADVDRLFNEQLGRCGVSYFDYYLLHALSKDNWAKVVATDALAQVQRYKTEGRVHNLGFSYHGDYDTFCEILAAADWDFVQIQINYLDNVMFGAKQYYDKLVELNIPCIVMEPIRGGFLANPPQSARDALAVGNAEDTAARLAFRWCLDLANAPLTLSGMSDMEKVMENIETFSTDKPLSAAERAAVDSAAEIMRTTKTVPCTACRYCMDCAFGVDIPEVFRIYNHYKLFNVGWGAKEDYTALGAHDATHCTRCGACSPLCPQGIDIPAALAAAHEELSALAAAPEPKQPLED